MNRGINEPDEAKPLTAPLATGGADRGARPPHAPSAPEASPAPEPAAGLIRQSAAGAGGEVLVLRLDAPPLNALSQKMRRALSGLLAGAARQGRPVILCGGPKVFSAATLIDLGDDLSQSPDLAELCLQIEHHPAPVVALIEGRAVGPGAELALAAHARVAGQKARIIFPEAGLGLPPQAGSSQRLPRLVGAADAIALLLEARSLGAQEALAIGLVDQLADGPGSAAGGADPLAAALTLVQRMKDEGAAALTGRRDGLADRQAYSAAIAAARAAQARNPLPAPMRLLSCIEAPLVLPPENGYALEKVAWEDLAEGPVSRGLVAAARAERQASLPPAGVLTAEASEVRSLGLYGSGPHQAALAVLALGRGLEVHWSDPDPAAQSPMLAWVKERIAAAWAGGSLSEAEYQAELARLFAPASPEALEKTGLVVHARPGPMASALARRAPGLVQLVSGGGGGAFPGLALAPSGRLSELGPALPGQGGGPVQLATALKMLRAFGLPAVLTGGGVGIGRRIQAAGREALLRLLESGVPAPDLRAALAAGGAQPPDLPDPMQSGAPRQLSEAEIYHRWTGAMANEGYRLIDEGLALQASDIDYIMVQGYGFPRWQGGPMHLAAERGALVLRADLRRWQAEGEIWAPHPRLDQLVSQGRKALSPAL